MTMAAGLRATAKAVGHPPEPTVGAPVSDPTAEAGRQSQNCRGLRITIPESILLRAEEVVR